MHTILKKTQKFIHSCVNEQAVYIFCKFLLNDQQDHKGTWSTNHLYSFNNMFLYKDKIFFRISVMCMKYLECLLSSKNTSQCFNLKQCSDHNLVVRRK